jgi:acyl-CoA synthetase (AMP-forming)/AMP-acid ligase II
MKLQTQANLQTLAQVLESRAETTPDKTLYTFVQNDEKETETVTYKELDAKARGIAVNLLKQARPGQRALMLYTSHKDFIFSFFGCLYAGIIAVPVKPTQNKNSDSSNLLAIAKNAEISLLLTTENFANTLENNTILSNYLKETKVVYTDTTETITDKTTLEVNKSGNDIAFLQYTSGSTGNPKGVIVLNRNLMHNLGLFYKSFNASSADIMASWLPFYHDMGLIGGILQPLFMGGSAVFISPMDFLQRPFRWLEIISRYKATISGAPNFAYDLCIKRVTDEQMKTLDLSSWRLAFNGAEKVRAETINNFTKRFSAAGFRSQCFYPTYGLAEGTLFAAGGTHDAEPTFLAVNRQDLDNNVIQLTENSDNDNTVNLVSCGTAWDDQEVLVVDTNTFTQCKEGAVGEIWLKGPSVTAGYWKNSSETERNYSARLSDKQGPYFRTGDLGFYHNKNLFVTGRIKDLIIINGRNIYPDDIEFEAQYKVSGLKIGNGAAFSCDIHEKESLILVQEIDKEKIKSTHSSAFNEITAALSNTFAIKPDAICFIMPHTLPKTTSGKIRRSTTKQQFLRGDLQEVDCWFANEAIKTSILETRESLKQNNIEAA